MIQCPGCFTFYVLPAEAASSVPGPNTLACLVRGGAILALSAILVQRIEVVCKRGKLQDWIVGYQLDTNILETL